MARKWLKYTSLLFLGAVSVAVIAVLIMQRVSDGPMEMLQGGPFRTGELITEPVTDWSFALERPVQFELVGFGTSRTAGYIVHDGIAYMTCDLGFIWSRLEPGATKSILSLIYRFKRWHLDAVEDGRALIRDGDSIYPVNFVKVEDPGLNAILRMEMEELASSYFAPGALGPAPVEPPNDVWFFRMDPRDPG